MSRKETRFVISYFSFVPNFTSLSQVYVLCSLDISHLVEVRSSAFLRRLICVFFWKNV